MIPCRSCRGRGEYPDPRTGLCQDCRGTGLYRGGAMTDRERLLIEVRDGDGSDADRLVYADWLEEYGRTPADAAHARLVRSMVAGPVDPLDAWKALRLLLPAALGAEFGVPASHSLGPPLVLSVGRGAFSVTLDRGFVSAVGLPCDRWTEGVVSALLADQPVRRVELTDKRPLLHAGGFWWRLDRGQGVYRECRLPDHLFSRLASYNALDARETGLSWATEALALDALSAAALAHGRRAAGLPDLVWPERYLPRPGVCDGCRVDTLVLLFEDRSAYDVAAFVRDPDAPITRPETRRRWLCRMCGPPGTR